MAKRTGDLWPAASGTASLGADQLRGPEAGFADLVSSEIRPFNHVHQNSGVFHDPLLGQSGVIRFNYATPGFEQSTDGGINFSALGAGGGASSLQEAYDGGDRIDVDPTPVFLNGVNTWPIHIATTEGGHAHMLISGVAQLPDTSTSYQTGSFWLQAHTAGTEVQYRGQAEVTNRAEASARSLGPDTFFYTTASGVVSLRAASGIATFYNNSRSANLDNTFIRLDLDRTDSNDQFYSLDGDKGIRIYVPGLYQIHYWSNIGKTEGFMPQITEARLEMEEPDGTNYRLNDSNSHAYVRDSTILNEGTMAGGWIGDLCTGDRVFLQVRQKRLEDDSYLADNFVQIEAKKTNVTIRWIGPLSYGRANRTAL